MRRGRGEEGGREGGTKERSDLRCTCESWKERREDRRRRAEGERRGGRVINVVIVEVMEGEAV